jgi:hypothetical protein
LPELHLWQCSSPDVGNLDFAAFAGPCGSFNSEPA